MASSVALLRGINVGGKNLLPMKDLVRLFEEAGCTGVRTYIQSGKLTTTYFDSRLATVSTGRNWRTVGRLFELAQA